MDWMLMPLRRYFDFEGRSRRMEYWMFQLFLVLSNLLFLAIIAAGFGWSEFEQLQASQTSGQAQDPAEVLALFGPLFWVGIALMTVWGLAMFIPNIAVSVRRLHDRDMSGWWYGGVAIASFLPIVNIFALFGYLVLFVLFLLPGTAGPNRYGPDPKDPFQTDAFD